MQKLCIYRFSCLNKLSINFVKILFFYFFCITFSSGSLAEYSPLRSPLIGSASLLSPLSIFLKLRPEHLFLEYYIFFCGTVFLKKSKNLTTSETKISNKQKKYFSKEFSLYRIDRLLSFTRQILSA